MSMIIILIFLAVLHLIQVMFTIISVVMDPSDFESRRSFVLCLLIPGYPIGKAIYRGWVSIGERDEKRQEKERLDKYRQEKIGNRMRINND